MNEAKVNSDVKRHVNEVTIDERGRIRIMLFKTLRISSKNATEIILHFGSIKGVNLVIVKNRLVGFVFDTVRILRQQAKFTPELTSAIKIAEELINSTEEKQKEKMSDGSS